MLTHHDDIEMVCGDDWVIVGKLLDEDGTPLDLSKPEVSMSWTLVGPDGNQVPGIAEAVTLEPADDGIVTITVSDALTRRLSPARYLDAIRVDLGEASGTHWVGIILANADPFHPTITTTLLLEAG